MLTLTLIGDTFISLWLTTSADRLGRRRVLVAGAILMAIAGVVFGLTDWLPLLILAGAIGVISPTGNEVGPFLAVEQAALTQTVPDVRRTATFAWYNLGGTSRPQRARWARDSSARRCSTAAWRRLDAYRAIVIGYAVIGLVMAFGFARLGEAIEAPPAKVATDGIRRRFGLGRSKGVVLRLSVLFSHRRLRRRLHPAEPHRVLVPPRSSAWSPALGTIFFGANLLAGGLVALGGAASRPGSASSTRWSSPTSRRTFC